MKHVLRFAAHLTGTVPRFSSMPCHNAIVASASVAAAVAADIARSESRYDISVTGEATFESVPSDHEKQAPSVETPTPTN